MQNRLYDAILSLSVDDADDASFNFRNENAAALLAVDSGAVASALEPMALEATPASEAATTALDIDDDVVTPPTAELEPFEPSEPPPAASPLPAANPYYISAAQILQDRPDVLKAFYEAFNDQNDKHSTAWAQRVGGETPEAYAEYWYKTYGKFQGYNQGEMTSQDNVSIERLLAERPDVLRGFYDAYYGEGNDRHSTAWMKRVGGDTPEDYARYWYDRYGKWEGYSQSERAAHANIDVERLLTDRPDVYKAFFEQFNGEANDKKSTAWIDRVGGDTVQDYAKYWYSKYGEAQGYNQRPPGPEPHDTSLDPWNHPALYPDWQPPYPEWEPPEWSLEFHPETPYVPRPPSSGAAGEDPSIVGQALTPADPIVV